MSVRKDYEKMSIFLQKGIDVYDDLKSCVKNFDYLKYYNNKKKLEYIKNFYHSMNRIYSKTDFYLTQVALNKLKVLIYCNEELYNHLDTSVITKFSHINIPIFSWENLDDRIKTFQDKGFRVSKMSVIPIDKNKDAVIKVYFKY